MSIAIDTNIFVYAQISGYAEHKKVHSYLEDFLNSGSNFYICWQVFYEYCRVMTHLKKTFNNPMTINQARDNFNIYLDLPSCRILKETENHYKTFNELISSLSSAKGSFVYDIHYACLLKEHGISQILTCDSDYKKFDFLEVINPALH